MRATDAEKFKAIAATQMTQLTEDLLLLARTEKLARENCQPVDLERILDSLVQLNAPRTQEKRINLKVVCLTSDLYLLGEPAHLSRLFFNDWKRTSVHFGGRYKIQASSEDHYLQVNVQGIGIAPEHLRHVFDRFWRADQSRAYWAGGSGLGLAIAQAIAQNHGGLITH